MDVRSPGRAGSAQISLQASWGVSATGVSQSAFTSASTLDRLSLASPNSSEVCGS